MKLFKMVLGLGLCAGTVLAFIAERAIAFDVVTARIQCPSLTPVTLNWRPAIGSDPTFKFGKSHFLGHDGRAWLKSMLRSGQLITCNYGLGREAYGNYSYTVVRAIQSCRQVDWQTLECVVKK